MNEFVIIGAVSGIIYESCKLILLLGRGKSDMVYMILSKKMPKPNFLTAVGFLYGLWHIVLTFTHAWPMMLMIWGITIGAGAVVKKGREEFHVKNKGLFYNFYRPYWYDVFDRFACLLIIGMTVKGW